MSLYGALFSGVSGLTAQSSSMGAIADNVTNINTVGYKGTQASFQTLVTKQVSITKYSPGGVQSRPLAGIDVQGLLTATSAATDIAVSGEGLFVVNESANPGSGDLWAYSRAGSFRMDESGYLKNTGGFYLQAWPLMPFDGDVSASVVKVGDIDYMKAYQDTTGVYTYINDNIIDSRNLQPVNLNTIGGSATPTRQIKLGANLPASDPIFDERTPENGGRQSLAVLVYDSLGNAKNVNFEYTKETENSWSLDAQMPEGAASVVVYDDRETTVDTDKDVYSARGQLEFTDIPDNHSTISITDDNGGTNEHTYVFEFSTDGTTSHVPAANETVVMVDIAVGVVSVNDALERFNTQIEAYVPSGARFSVENDTIAIHQSTSGAALYLQTASCLQCKQSASNPNLITGIPSGAFDVPEIDWEIKNGGKIDFSSTASADYLGNVMCIGSKVYELTNGGGPADPNNVEVDISTAITAGVVNRQDMVALIEARITQNGTDTSRFDASGVSIEIEQSENGGEIMVNMGDTTRLDFIETDRANYNGVTVAIGGQTYQFTNGGGAGANIEVDLSGIPVGASASTPIAVVNLLKSAIEANDLTPGRYVADGDTLFSSNALITAGGCSSNLGVVNEIASTGVGAAVTGELKSDGSTSSTPLGATALVIGDSFTFNGEVGAEDGGKAPAVRFNSDGTPKYFNVDDIEIEWSNGAQNMNGQQDEGALISLFMGNVNTPDGLTHLAGDFIPNYISQDGAKFGNFAGVTIGQDGVVTALFDNGETRPIAMVPLATFVNPNGMESLTGNAWIETDFSGQPTLRQAGDGGAGSINSGSLESSTVDLGEEFTAMITTQRAYSAAAKIITTSDEMLEELMRVKR